MFIRLAYLKRDENGKILWDGVELDSELDVDMLPRIGEHVFLPPRLWGPIMPDSTLDVCRRYIVVRVEHKWDRLVAPIYDVHVADMVDFREEGR
jgi:hypothetical protein